MLVMITSGETEAERDKVYLGRGDSPLTIDGKEQIADAAETLSVYQFDAVYSSDLYRAQEATRSIVRANPYRVPVTLAEELRERSGGSYEGETYSSIRKGMSPKQYRVWERDPAEAPLHGESLIDVRDRIEEWFKTEITPKLEDNQNVLIVTHPDTLRVVIAIARGDSLTDATDIKIEHGMPYFYYFTPR